VNGRNFLYDGERIYGVDFEERAVGSKARDAGRLAAFLETYETCDRENQAALSEAFMHLFANKFACEMNELLAERNAEFEAMRLRRHHPPQP